MGYILLVEDDENIRQFLSTILRREGYKVVSAPNGAVALEIAAEREPGLILLDMHMPTMDGPTFLKAYRSADTLHTPIVAVTVDHLLLSTKVREAVDNVLIKPFAVGDLLNCVQQYVRTTAGG